ncbi:MAG: hypothetical protein CMP10_00260 [Zetaproteobacteria bacterium]|nr:hypothetical protein [Pseudobdellovibrionaceae bacterium]
MNIITILIVIFSVGLFLRLYRDRKSKSESEEPVTASDVATDIMKDPLIVSRSYFTGTTYGSLGTFEGQQSKSQHMWISGKTIQV